MASADVDRLGTFTTDFTLPGNGPDGDVRGQGAYPRGRAGAHGGPDQALRAGDPDRRHRLPARRPAACPTDSSCVARATSRATTASPSRSGAPAMVGRYARSRRGPTAPAGSASSSASATSSAAPIASMPTASSTTVPSPTSRRPARRLNVDITPDCGPAGGPPDRMSVRVAGLRVPAAAAGLRHLGHAAQLRGLPDADGPRRQPPDGHRAVPTWPRRVRRARPHRGREDRHRSPAQPCPSPSPVRRARRTWRPPSADDRPSRARMEWRWQVDLTGSGFRPGEVAVVFDSTGVVGPQRFVLTADEAGRLDDIHRPGRWAQRPLPHRGPPGRRATPRPRPASRPSSPSPGRPPSEPPAVRWSHRRRLDLVDICGPEAPGQEGAYDIAVSGEGFYSAGVVRIAFGSGSQHRGRSGRLSRRAAYERTISPSGRERGEHTRSV